MKHAALLTALLAVATCAKAGLVAGGVNELTVNQTITPLGGGEWQYQFNITSQDPSNVWEFILYTTFGTTNGKSVNFPFVAPTGLPLSGVLPVYDARNINPALTTDTDEWYTPFGGSNGVPTGGTAALIFDASVYDPSPKLFAYETSASGYAGGGLGPLGSKGEVEAIGYTSSPVPEPGVLSLVGLGLGALAGWRRRAH